MTTLFLVIQVVIAIIITISVLLQKSSSIGLGQYSGSNESLFGAKGPAGFLAKFTAVMGILFVINTLALAYFYQKDAKTSILDSVDTSKMIEENAVPATPSVPSVPQTNAPVAPIAPALPQDVNNAVEKATNAIENTEANLTQGIENIVTSVENNLTDMATSVKENTTAIIKDANETLHSIDEAAKSKMNETINSLESNLTK